MKRDFNDHFDRIDTILLSRKMAADGYLTHWANAAMRHSSDPFFSFAKRITDMRKIILTDKRSPSSLERTDLRSGDLPMEIGRLKAEPGADIGVFGGAGFASALIREGLVYELQFYINPVVLGDGVRIFSSARFRHLRMLQAKSYPSGMIVSRYAWPSGES